MKRKKFSLFIVLTDARIQQDTRVLKKKTFSDSFLHHKSNPKGPTTVVVTRGKCIQ